MTMGLFSKKPAAPQTDDRWEALNAEYQNYRRRTTMEMDVISEKSAMETVAAFLHLYDDLQRALESPCSDPSFYKGVELIQKSLMDTFASLGVKPKDPQYRPDEVVEVLRVGFTMHDEVIRHARVVVANCE